MSIRNSKSRLYGHNYNESYADNNIARIFTNDKSIKVVLRSNFNDNKEVALISGGGSGHEPSHAGFVVKYLHLHQHNQLSMPLNQLVEPKVFY